MARPKLPSGKKRTKQVNVSLRPAELRALQRLAAGRPASDYLYDVVRKVLDKTESVVVDSARG